MTMRAERMTKVKTVTRQFLESGSQLKPDLVFFCRECLFLGLFAELRETSASKYVDVFRREGPRFRARFSGHRMTRHEREQVNFDVGPDGTVEQAVEAAVAFLEAGKCRRP